MIDVIQGDITRIKTDALVNSANPSLLAGGGVCGAIHRTAGKELEAACRKIGGCSVGNAVATPAFFLPATWVIHAVGPQWLGGQKGEIHLLEQCYKNIARVAAELGSSSITVPSVSTGIYRFPLDLAADIAIRSLRVHGSSIERITVVCFDPTTLAAYRRAISGE